MAPESLPLITLYLSERCNSRCVTCDYWRYGQRDMSLELVDRMLPDLASLDTRDVLISGGEPLLNPEWREIADLLRQNGMRLWLLTSGLSLAKHAEAVAERFDSVTVSLDGANDETYMAIRGVSAFDKVCTGISAVARAGTHTGIRVTLQRGNLTQLPLFVSLAKELAADYVSFLAVDIGNQFAFARQSGLRQALIPDSEELAGFDESVELLQSQYGDEFDSGFIAESPEKLRRIGRYFAALNGDGAFPAVLCNAPEFSAVITADGRIAPCFFIAGPVDAPVAPAIRQGLNSMSMKLLRKAIRDKSKRECETCVCSMWREPEALAGAGFVSRARRNAGTS